MALHTNSPLSAGPLPGQSSDGNEDAGQSPVADSPRWGKVGMVLTVNIGPSRSCGVAGPKWRERANAASRTCGLCTRRPVSHPTVAAHQALATSIPMCASFDSRPINSCGILSAPHIDYSLLISFLALHLDTVNKCAYY